VRFWAPAGAVSLARALEVLGLWEAIFISEDFLDDSVVDIFDISYILTSG
jgi:hypothetical protein